MSENKSCCLEAEKLQKEVLVLRGMLESKNKRKRNGEKIISEEWINELLEVIRNNYEHGERPFSYSNFHCDVGHLINSMATPPEEIDLLYRRLISRGESLATEISNAIYGLEERLIRFSEILNAIRKYPKEISEEKIKEL